MTRSLLLLLFAFVLVTSVGCERRVMWEHRDDPYLHDVSLLTEDEVLSMTRSFYIDDRQLALRELANRSARARERGDDTTADRLVLMLIRQYEKYRDPEVRGTIISLCAPVCASESERMMSFLRKRIAEGAWVVEAAHALAAARPDDGLSILMPLTQHPSPEIRFEAAMALTCLGDPAARPVVDGVVAEMHGERWPGTLRDIPLANARELLAARSARLWGGQKESAYRDAQSPVQMHPPRELPPPDAPHLPAPDTLPEYSAP